MKNIALIGMPGAGKSTIGVLLAKTLGMNFVDTDILIQREYGRLLQDIINQEGIQKFLSVEEECISNMKFENAVIATGGSVVYSEKAMGIIKSNGITVYLKVPLNEIMKRIQNIKTRGIVLRKGQTVQDIYLERAPLYEQYANIIVDEEGRDVEQVIEIIIRQIRQIDTEV